MKSLDHLRIPLDQIKQATNNFDEENNYITKHGSATVYKGKLFWSGSLITVAVKRLDFKLEHRDREFHKEISLLAAFKHKNIVSLVGFCDEGEEKICVFLHENRGSLDKYISSTNLTWIQRLQISIDAARGINYLHDEVGRRYRAVHRDIKSGNILLNEDWEAKLSDFGISKIGSVNHFYYNISKVVGTLGYVDPEHHKAGLVPEKSDVYSFGVVLFEILCGRLACDEGYKDGQKFLGPLAVRLYEEDKLDEIIDPILRKQMRLNSLITFSKIAYQCVKNKLNERPTMDKIVEQLETALELQITFSETKIARVGTWGTNVSGDTKNGWSFLLAKEHILKMITVDHGAVINSFIFTSKAEGVLHTSKKVTGWHNGSTTSQVMFEDGEEVIGIQGTIGLPGGYSIISSLSFITNKKAYGPFGTVTGTPFMVPWDKGTFAGFYGFGDYYIHSIGVFLKATV